MNQRRPGRRQGGRLAALAGRHHQVARGRLHLLIGPGEPLTARAALLDRATETTPAVCEWPGDKRWVYSITFDEALSDLRRFAIPILRDYGVPGHVEVVVGQMGQVRAIGGSSFDGFKHMGPAELRELVSWGWGVGNHSWSHGAVGAENVEQELGEAKRVLEDAIEQPVTIYCAPGSNANMNEAALAGCRRFGYLGAMSITDALNRPDDADLLWLNRTFLHHQGYGPFFSEFDPFRNLQHARRDRGWIIDYLHCPLEQPIHPNKDCSQAQLRERIHTVVAEGAGDVWLTRVEDAADYRYLRRHTQIHPEGSGATGGGTGTAGMGRSGAGTGVAGAYTVSAPGLPAQVRGRTVTLRLPRGTHAVEIDGARVAPYWKAGTPLVDVDLPSSAPARGVRLMG